jgi:ankyrin repeat protein
MQPEVCRIQKSEMNKVLLNEVAHGDAETLPNRIQQLLEQGADANSQDEKGKTPLHLLLSSYQEDFLSSNRKHFVQSLHTLLKRGALVNKTDWTGQCSVHYAASMNMPSEVLLPIIRKCDISKLSPAVVHELVSTDNLDINILVALCQSQVDLAVPDENNSTAIHRMVEKHRATDTLLIHTLAHERPEDFNRIKDDVLSHACLHGSKETVQALLQLGASWNIKFGQNGLPALLLAASSSDTEEAIQKVEVLLANGVDIHMTSSNGQNLCHIAAIQQNARLLEKALSLRIDHKKSDAEGNTPLHYACTTPDNGTVITYLVDAGLDSNKANSEGLTPLYLAISSSHINNVVPLVRAGANIEHAGLDASYYHKLQILAQPEVIVASPRPLEYALHMSYFFEKMASNNPRVKQRYMELSKEMEDVAIAMADGLQSTKLRRLVLNGAIVEMAVKTNRKRFVANEVVQEELDHVWEEKQAVGLMAYTLSLLIFIARVIARPLVMFVIWPLVAFRVRVFGHHLSWHILYPCAAPVISYIVGAVFYFVFVVFLLIEANAQNFSSTSLSVVEWVILVHVLASVLNVLLTVHRDGLRVFFTSMGSISLMFTLVLFVVFFVLRFVGISMYASDMLEGQTLFRVSRYVLVPPMLLACLCLLDVLHLHPRLGPIQTSFIRMRQEVLLFNAILLVYLLAFALSLAIIYNVSELGTGQNTANNTDCHTPDAFKGVDRAAVTLFWSLFGIFDIGDLKTCEFVEEVLGTIIMALWLVQSFIVLINILIALVTIKFEETQSHADIEWKFLKSVTILSVKQCQQVPVPFNLLHSIVDLLEWLFTRHGIQQKRAFSLIPDNHGVLRGQLELGNASDIQVEVFKQAEEKKALSQTGTKEDLGEINSRLQAMNLTLTHLYDTVTHQKGHQLTVEKKEDYWIPYRKRLYKFSGRNEYMEESDEEDRFAPGKTILGRMVSKRNYTALNARDSEQKPYYHFSLPRVGPVQHDPRLSLESTYSSAEPSSNFRISQSNTVIQALSSLQNTIETQGKALQHAQTKLANMEVRMEYFKTFAKKKAKFETLDIDEDVV